MFARQQVHQKNLKLFVVSVFQNIEKNCLAFKFLQSVTLNWKIVCASDFLGISIIIYIPLIFKLGFTRLSDLYQYCIPYRHTIKDPAGNNFLLLPRGKRGLVRRLKLAINTKQHTRTKTLTRNKYPLRYFPYQ